MLTLKHYRIWSIFFVLNLQVFEAIPFKKLHPMKFFAIDHFLYHWMFKSNFWSNHINHYRHLYNNALKWYRMILSYFFVLPTPIMNFCNYSTTNWTCCTNGFNHFWTRKRDFNLSSVVAALSCRCNLQRRCNSNAVASAVIL